MEKQRYSIVNLSTGDVVESLSKQELIKLSEYLKDNSEAIIEGKDDKFKPCSSGALFCAVGAVGMELKIREEKCTCESRNHESRPCPYQGELHDNWEDFCNCCEHCENQCNLET